MTNVYLICALVGGTLFVCQLLLAAVGIGDHHDISIDHDTNFSHGGGAGFWHLFSFRAIVSALTVFGLAGMASHTAKLAQPMPPLIAAASAMAVALLVGFVMRSMNKLAADGTSDIQNTRGATGTVYLPVPGKNAGLGKVQLDVQNRTLELQAVTFDQALETGTKIVVVDVVAPDTVEVIAVPQMRNPHVA